MSSIGEKQPIDHEVVVVDNVAFADAMAKAKPNPLSKRMLQLYLICLCGMLNSCINGYDGSLMGAINGMEEQYQDYFGVEPTGSRTGFIFAIYTIGNIVGSFGAGPATDKWGRRWGMWIGAATIILGTCVQATATAMPQFIGGRFVLGVGVAFSATAGPSYVVEMAHPAYRGILTGIYNSFWNVGAIPASWVSYGTAQAFSSTLAWRIPLWLQMTFSGVIVLSVLWLPETPRWLMANDRTEEALAVLTKYHGEGDRNNPFVELSYREMKEEISLTGSDKRWWDYRELANTKSARWRLTMVISMAFFGQWSGNAAISYFMPVMAEQAGINDTDTRLMLNAIITCVSFVGSIIGSTIVDKAGRRKMLFTASCLFVLWFSIIAGLSAKFAGSGNVAGSNATIAVIYLFGFTYAVAFTPFQALYPVECLKFETRAKGMATYNFWVNIASFFNQYVTPIGLGDVQWKFYFLYIAWDAFQAFFIYMFYVETKNRTLEELNEIFEQPNPKKASLAKAKVAVAAGRGITEVLEGEGAPHKEA